MKEPLKLRAHHGMCLAFFEGKGYSSAFTENMGKVLEEMEEDTPLELCREKDIICSACPNLEEGVCITGEKVKAYDEKVLKACGLQPGSRLTWQEFSNAVKHNIIEAGKRKDICGDCSWTEICSRKEQLESGCAGTPEQK